MKKTLALFLSVVMAVSLFGGIGPLVSAESEWWKCGDNLTWSGNGMVITISGTGDMYDYSWDTPAPWGNILSEIIVEPGVTSIGDYAFKHVLGKWIIENDPPTLEEVNTIYPIDKITLPEGLTRIGEAAFDGINVEEIEIPSTVTEIESRAFSSARLKKVVFRGGVETIGSYAFSYTLQLKDIVLPDGLKNIGEAAFSHSVLESVNIPESVTNIGDGAFASCHSLKNVYIPAGVESIGIAVFSNSKSIEKMEISEDNENYIVKDGCLIEVASKKLIAVAKDFVIPNDGSIEVIGGYVFSDRDDIESVVIPEGVKLIEEKAFINCSNLKEVIFPDSLETIGSGAFYECSNLKEVILPDNLERIGSEAFYKCENLSKVYLSKAFNPGLWFDASIFERCYGITELEVHPENEYFYSEGNCIMDGKQVVFGCAASVIPEGATSIGLSAFKYCRDLERIVIPDSVKRINQWAFAACPNLKEIVIGEGVENIGLQALSGCDSLKSLHFPKSLVSIASGNLQCEALEEITVAEGNPVYKASGNCLINIEKKMLIAAFGDFVIPDDGSVTSIGAYPFTGEYDTVVIPRGITECNDFAFFHTSGIKELVIYSDNIELGAFFGQDDTSNLLIKCFEGSTAHKLAKERGIAFELMYVEGDMDGDHVITVSDALTLLRIAAGLDNATAYSAKRASTDLIGDMDYDGVITVSDALSVLRIAAGLSKIV